MQLSTYVLNVWRTRRGNTAARKDKAKTLLRAAFALAQFEVGSVPLSWMMLR
jgi:hypothetical protein